MKTPIERGMIPQAWEAYQVASKAAGIDINSRDDHRLVQLVGNAAASAGYHKSDGTYQGREYTAAADLSVRELSDAQIYSWVKELCAQGFVPFYRNWEGNRHIHMNYAGAPMKDSLQMQCRDFFNGKDGLKNHGSVYTEPWYPDAETRAIPQAMFAISNGTNPRFCSAEDGTVPQVTYALNGSSGIKIDDLPVIDGSSYVMARKLTTWFGAKIVWNEAEKSIYINGNATKENKIIDGSGYVKFTEAALIIGLKYTVNNDTRHIDLVSQGANL